MVVAKGWWKWGEDGQRVRTFSYRVNTDSEDLMSSMVAKVNNTSLCT